MFCCIQAEIFQHTVRCLIHSFFIPTAQFDTLESRTSKSHLHGSSATPSIYIVLPSRHTTSRQNQQNDDDDDDYDD